MPEYSPVLPIVLSAIPALLSRNTIGLLLVGGIVGYQLTLLKIVSSFANLFLYLGAKSYGLANDNDFGWIVCWIVRLRASLLDK